jgi:hypothetical protein
MSTTIMGSSSLSFICSSRDLPVLVIQYDFIHLHLHTTMMVYIPSTMMRVHKRMVAKLSQGGAKDMHFTRSCMGVMHFLSISCCATPTSGLLWRHMHISRHTLLILATWQSMSWQQ